MRVKKVSRVIHLVMREIASIGDKIESRSNISMTTQLRWWNCRSYLLNSKVRASYSGKTPSNRPYFSVTNDVTGGSFYFGDLIRGRSLFKGVLSLANNLANGYGLKEIKFQDGDLAIDVGANFGLMKLYLDYCLPDVEIDYLGIEPGPDEFFFLEKNISGVKAKCLNIAISDSVGPQAFYYSPAGADSSLHQPPNVIAVLETQCATLDLILNTEPYGNRRVKILKIDAEGSEFEVLKGSSNSLSRIDYIAVDLGFEKGIKQESPAPECIEFLLSNGFCIQAVTLPHSIRILFRNRTIAK